MEEALSEQLKNTKIQKSDDKVVKRGCYYTKIPRLIKQKGILGQDLTSLNLDKVLRVAKLPFYPLEKHKRDVFLIPCRQVFWKAF